MTLFYIYVKNIIRNQNCERLIIFSLRCHEMLFIKCTQYLYILYTRIRVITESSGLLNSSGIKITGKARSSSSSIGINVVNVIQYCCNFKYMEKSAFVGNV